jgi:hypothetical protein
MSVRKVSRILSLLEARGQIHVPAALFLAVFDMEEPLFDT